jgi:hypothetical protein
VAFPAYQPLAVQPSYPTASLAAQAQAMTAFRAAQDWLMLMLIRDVLKVWGSLNLQDVRSSWPALRIAIAALVREQFGLSAAQAQAYYAAARLAAGVPGPFPAPSVPLPSPELIQATLDSTGPWALLGRIKKAQPVPQAMQNTGVVLSGAASRLVLNGARQVILQSVQDDAEAVGWMRVTAANPCSWCSMLSSRGPVYRSEASAGFKAHSHCRCSAMAVFSHSDAEALTDNPLRQQWDQVTRGLSGRDALNAWRRWWNSEHPDAMGSHLAA